MLMRDRKHGRVNAGEVVPDGVWKSTQNIKAEAVFIHRPHIRPLGKTIERLHDQCTEGVGSNWAALEVPQESFSNLFFRGSN